MLLVLLLISSVFADDVSCLICQGNMHAFVTKPFLNDLCMQMYDNEGGCAVIVPRWMDYVATAESVAVCNTFGMCDRDFELISVDDILTHNSLLVDSQPDLVIPENEVEFEEPQSAQDNTTCTVCTKVVSTAQEHADDIQTALDEACSQYFNTTAKRIACQAAVNQGIKAFENDDPTALCTSLGLCGSSNALFTPSKALCGVCAKSAGFFSKVGPRLGQKLKMKCEQTEFTDELEMNSCIRTALTIGRLLGSVHPDAFCSSKSMCPEHFRLE